MSVTLVVILGLATVVLVMLAGVLAAAETAFTRVTRSRVDAIAAADAEDHDGDDDVDDRIEQLRAYSRHPATTLASLELVQLADQAGAVACAWFVGREIAGVAGSVVAVAAVAVALFAVMVVSRSRSLSAPDAAAVGLVPILRLVAPLDALTGVIVRLARRSQPAEISDPDVDEQQVLALVGETEAIDDDEEALIKRVVAFDDTTAGSIMTHRSDLVSLRSGFAVQDALQVAALHGLSRIPVTSSDGDIDDIIGAVHVKDLWIAQLDDKGAVDIDLWLREVQVVPEVQRVAQLLTALQTSDMHLAVVADEHGGVAGVVTLEDILEELVGEIEDEFDAPEADLIAVDDRTLRVDGRTEITRIRDAFGIEFSGDFRTVAGAVFNGLGRVPEVGDVHSIDDAGLELHVVRMHGRRIADVDVRSTTPLPGPDAKANT
ncbi:MAG: hemolysin family protein [Actinomycetota bacterium]